MIYSYEDKIVNGEKKLIKVINAEELIEWMNNTEQLLNRIGTKIATLQSQIEHLSERVSNCSGHSRW